MDRSLCSSSSSFGHSSSPCCNEAAHHNSAAGQHDPQPCTSSIVAWNRSLRTVAKVDGSRCERHDGGCPVSAADSDRKNTCPSSEDGCS